MVISESKSGYERNESNSDVVTAIDAFHDDDVMNDRVENEETSSKR